MALKLFPSPSSSASSACSSHQVVHLQNQGANGSSSSSSTSRIIPSGLTPDEYTQLQSALSRIALWRARSDRGGGRLTHAIDMSAGLAGILLLDAQQQQQRQNSTSTSSTSTSYSNFTLTTPTINQLRQTYSTILLRSVNGLADSFRSQKKSATLSVSHCCVALAGLPSWLVDIRHDASHNDLPSLGVCRIGALEMLKYWRERYWNVVDGRVWGSSGTKNEKNYVSSDVERGEGAYTLAYDCLSRYQMAAMKEAAEREEKTMQLQKHPLGSSAEEVGISRRAKLRQFARENKAEENEQGVNNSIQDEAKDTTVDATAEDYDMIPIPADKSTSRKVRKRASATDAAEKEGSNSRGGGGSANFFSILYDDKPKQKKKKTKSDTAAAAAAATESSNTAEEKVGDVNNASDTKGSKTLSENAAAVASDVNKKVSEQAKQSPPAPTSRDCAAEFIRTVPMDIAFSSTLRFLVWGQPPSSPTSNVIDETGSEVNGPALLALPSSSSLVNSTNTQSSNNKLEAAFEQLRLMNDPILISMINAYPGFIKALFSHLVDSLLCLVEAREATSQLDTNNKEEGNEMIDLAVLECNIHHLVKWVQYLLSREFHMHFDRSVAMFVSEKYKMQHLLAEEQPDDIPADGATIDDREGDATQQTGLSSQHIDLKKKGRKKWNSEELVFMQSPLDYKFLNEVGLPLNSVCDRLDTHQQNQLSKHSESGRAADASSEDSTTVHELYQFLECIIGKQNRVLFMGLCDNSMGGAPAFRSGMSVKEYSSTDTACIQKKQQTPSTTNAMSLEDIEAMVVESNSSTPEEVLQENGHSVDDDANFTGICIQPWTLCKHWDACDIGTMPGCPS